MLVAALLASVFASEARAEIAVSKSIDNTQQAYPSTIAPGDITAFRITLTNDNTLRLRGCIVAPLCKTQTWTRVQ